MGNSTTDWDNFCNDVNNFGILKWDIKQQRLSTTVNFLDLTLTINNDTITSKTYQKEMNLYLYLPAASAHPQGCIKGTIYGLIRRYFNQNTYRKDYVHIVGLFYRRICARGWDPAFVRNLITEASTRIETASTAQQTAPPAQLNANNNTRIADEIYLHFQFHPNDISRRQIRAIYDEHLADQFHNTLGIKRAIVAYSRPKNIGDHVTQAKLHEAAGNTASIIMGEYNLGSNP